MGSHPEVFPAIMPLAVGIRFARAIAEPIKTDLNGIEIHTVEDVVFDADVIEPIASRHPFIFLMVLGTEHLEVDTGRIDFLPGGW